MSSRYPHAQLLLDGLPILEATDFSADFETRATIVETAGHRGVMKARGKPKFTFSLDVQIPRTGHEYDYVAQLRDGETVIVRWVDSGTVYDGECLIQKYGMRDSPNGERSCTISGEGYLVNP